MFLGQLFDRAVATGATAVRLIDSPWWNRRKSPTARDIAQAIALFDAAAADLRTYAREMGIDLPPV